MDDPREMDRTFEEEARGSRGRDRAKAQDAAKFAEKQYEQLAAELEEARAVLEALTSDEACEKAARLWNPRWDETSEADRRREIQEERQSVQAALQYAQGQVGEGND